MPVKTWKAISRAVGESGENGTNVFWSANNGNIETSFYSTHDYKACKITWITFPNNKYSGHIWSYGSGSVNRPLSESCKFYIRY